VLDELRRRVPGLVVERLQVTHPEDDDNVYFICDPRGLDRVQIDTRPNGQPPFLIEADERYETNDATQASAIIHDWLTSKPATGGDTYPY
jgi:hypothetical protein